MIPKYFFIKIPCIQYTKPLSGGLTTHKFNGTSWVVVETGVAPNGSTDLDVKLDNNSVPYLVYEENLADLVRVMKFNGTGWSDAVGGGFDTQGGGYPVIDFDEQNGIYVIYVKGAGSDSYLSLVAYDGITWEHIDEDFTNGAASFPSLYVANSGIYYVSFSNANVQGKASVYKYDIANKIDEYFAKKEQLVYPNPSTGSISFELKQSEIDFTKDNYEIIITDMQGKVVKILSLSNSLLNYEFTNKQQGIYLVHLVKNNQRMTTQKLILVE